MGLERGSSQNLESMKVRELCKLQSAHEIYVQLLFLGFKTNYQDFYSLPFRK